MGRRGVEKATKQRKSLLSSITSTCLPHHKPLHQIDSEVLYTIRVAKQGRSVSASTPPQDKQPSLYSLLCILGNYCAQPSVHMQARRSASQQTVVPNTKQLGRLLGENK